MGILNLDDWKTLWKFDKPQKPTRPMSRTVGTWNRSCGDLSSRRTYLKPKSQDIVDGPSIISSPGSQSWQRSEKRAGSLPPNTRREFRPNQARSHGGANGMVEPMSPTQTTNASFGASLGTSLGASLGASLGEQEDLLSVSAMSSAANGSSDRRATSNSDGRRRTRSFWNKVLPTRESSVDLSQQKTKSQTSLAKEPFKKWQNQLSHKSTDDLNTRYEIPSKISPQDVAASGHSANFNQARLMFQQLSEESSNREHIAYNESLGRRFKSQPNVTSSRDGSTSQNQNDYVLASYNYPRNIEVANHANLHRRANNSRLPEADLSSFSTEAEINKFKWVDEKAGHNIALLAMSSEHSEAATSESPVTSTPRSSTRNPKAFQKVERQVITESFRIAVQRFQLRMMRIDRSSSNSEPDPKYPQIPTGPEWEIFDITLKRPDLKSEIGFEMVGGRGEEVRKGDCQIYVSKLIPNQTAALDKRLHVGDIITAIHGVQMESHKEASHALRRSGLSVCLTVKRFVGKVHVIAITLKKNGQPLGLTVTGGVGNEVRDGDSAIYVTDISPKGVASRHGSIEVGDRIDKVNDVSLRNVNHHYATECLRNAGDTVEIVLSKTGRVNPLLFCPAQF